MAWIRSYTKSHPSFFAAHSDALSTASGVSQHLGPSNVKHRVRKRANGRFDAIVWRRSVDTSATPLASVKPAMRKVDVSTRLANAATKALLIALARAETRGVA
jgi:hypothetical protein